MQANTINVTTNVQGCVMYFSICVGCQVIHDSKREKMKGRKVRRKNKTKKNKQIVVFIHLTR